MEKPILFNADMVKAVLEGRKTQTRRIIKNQPPDDIGNIIVGDYHPVKIDKNGDEYPGAEIFGAYDDAGEWGSKCPYGKPGDLLWVRETWCQCPECSAYQYRAHDHDGECWYCGDELHKWKPSIFMPREASRITLQVTTVRVERLQDISAVDAMWEGIEKAHNYINKPTIEALGSSSLTGLACIDQFRKLWNSINAKRGYNWETNPWVWVVEFERMT